MNIKDIIKKMLAGEELTAEEKAFLESYQEPSNDNKIPKTRLDSEIQKRKDAEKKVSDMEERVSSLEEQLEEKNSGDLSEVEKANKAHEKEIGKLQKQIETLTGERDAATKELTGLKFDSGVSKLAKEHAFSDVGYLNYQIKQRGIDINDEDQAKEFMKELKANKDFERYFTVDAKPGAGSPPSPDGKGTEAERQKLDGLLKKEGNLSSREVGEVIELQEKLDAAGE